MEVLLGKSSVNGPFSIAMLNYQRVYAILTPLFYGIDGLFIYHFSKVHMEKRHEFR